MTRQEFDIKFNSCYKKAMMSYSYKEQLLSTFNSESLKSCSTEELLIKATTELFSIGLEVNQKVLHSVLSEVLAFDD